MAISTRKRTRVTAAGSTAAPGRFRRAFPYIWRSLVSLLLLMAAAFGASAAGTPSARTISAPAGEGAGPDEEQVEHLLELEQQAVAADDVAGLMTLWAPDSSVTDARFTPNVPEDDLRWRGRPAVQRRYQREVIPAGAGAARSVTIQVEGERATALVPAGSKRPRERWSFVKRNGRWWIVGLTTNLNAS